MKREELLVNAKPRLFNTEMVKAILEDRKTVTRRLVKLPKWVKEEDKELNTFYFSTNDRGDSGVIDMQGLINYLHLNPCQVGDILYVRETYSYVYEYGSEENLKWEIKKYVYKTDESLITSLKWKPSIHMPKEAARIFLKVTGVRVERLNDITSKEAIKEGLKDKYAYGEYNSMEPKKLFIDLWNSTIKKQFLDKYGWEANPYVWVIEFERVNYE